jgi:hypothetical protein
MVAGYVDDPFVSLALVSPPLINGRQEIFELLRGNLQFVRRPTFKPTKCCTMHDARVAAMRKLLGSVRSTNERPLWAGSDRLGKFDTRGGNRTFAAGFLKVCFYNWIFGSSSVSLFDLGRSRSSDTVK